MSVLIVLMVLTAPWPHQSIGHGPQIWCAGHTPRHLPVPEPVMISGGAPVTVLRRRHDAKLKIVARLCATTAERGSLLSPSFESENYDDENQH